MLSRHIVTALHELINEVYPIICIQRAGSKVLVMVWVKKVLVNQRILTLGSRIP